MTCDAFLDRAWAEHGERPRLVAEQLLTSLGVIKRAAEIPHYAALVVHVFGEHLGEWREGIELLARLSELDCFETSGEAGTALHRAATTLELAATGDTAPLAALSISERVRVLAVAASALAARDELERAGRYFHHALAECQGLPPTDRAHADRRKDLAGFDLAIEGVRQCVAQVSEAERGQAEQRLSTLLAVLAAPASWR